MIPFVAESNKSHKELWNRKTKLNEEKKKKTLTFDQRSKTNMFELSVIVTWYRRNDNRR